MLANHAANVKRSNGNDHEAGFNAHSYAPPYIVIHTFLHIPRAG